MPGFSITPATDHPPRTSNGFTPSPSAVMVTNLESMEFETGSVDTRPTSWGGVDWAPQEFAEWDSESNTLTFNVAGTYRLTGLLTFGINIGTTAPGTDVCLGWSVQSASGVATVLHGAQTTHYTVAPGSDTGTQQDVTAVSIVAAEAGASVTIAPYEMHAEADETVYVGCILQVEQIGDYFELP